MKEGKTKYTPSGGLVELKDAVINKLKRDQGANIYTKRNYDWHWCETCFYTLFQVILDPDDEVIIPTPYWVSYPEQVKLAGGVPVHIEGTRQHNLK